VAHRDRLADLRYGIVAVVSLIIGVGGRDRKTVVEGVNGTYFEDVQPAVPFVPGVRRGVADYALDPEKAARLWALSEEMLTAVGS
jgi:hypothetical protein